MREAAKGTQGSRWKAAAEGKAMTVSWVYARKRSGKTNQEQEPKSTETSALSCRISFARLSRFVSPSREDIRFPSARSSRK